MLGLLDVFRDGDSALHGKLAFDKDDSTSMRFVCAAANLRSAVFGIEKLSFHDCKGVAGNIVPAIATTNAIIAGALHICLYVCVCARMCVCVCACERAPARLIYSSKQVSRCLLP